MAVATGINFESGNMVLEVPGGDPAMVAGAQVAVLQKISSIDGTTVADTTAFTATLEFVITGMVVILRSISGGGAVPQVSLGRDAGAEDILPAFPLIGVTAALGAFPFSVNGKMVVVSKADVLKFGVKTAATFSTYVMDVHVMGYSSP